jgi:hypothetical protein
MEENVIKVNHNDRVGVMIVISVLTTLYLFYIDEGYYSFAWMKEPGSWFIFLIYVTFFTFIQFIIRLFFFKNMSSIRRNVIVAAIGLPVSLILIYILFNFIRG